MSSPAHRFPPALHARISPFPAVSHSQTQSLRWLGRSGEPPQPRRDPLAARTGRATRFHPRRSRLGGPRRSAAWARPSMSFSAIPSSAASAIGLPANCRPVSANWSGGVSRWMSAPASPRRSRAVSRPAHRHRSCGHGTREALPPSAAQYPQPLREDQRTDHRRARPMEGREISSPRCARRSRPSARNA